MSWRTCLDRQLSNCTAAQPLHRYSYYFIIQNYYLLSNGKISGKIAKKKLRILFLAEKDRKKFQKIFEKNH
jgi:hypothetical protein